MRLTRINQKIALVEFRTPQVLCYTMLRFGEHYESPRFQGEIFTREEYLQWWSEQGYPNSYYDSWTGYNFPRSVLEPFYNGSFAPLDAAERAYLECVRRAYEDGAQYFIASAIGDHETISHELVHALYCLNDEYRREVLETLNHMLDLPRKEALKAALTHMGYAHDVLADEANAFLSTSFDWFMQKTRLNPRNYRAVSTELRSLYHALLD